MRQSLAPILDVLDSGLRLYRVNFVLFAALAGLGAVPFIVVIGGSFFATIFFGSTSSGMPLLAAGVLGLLFLVYAIAAISRAGMLLARGERPGIGQALRLAPLRALGMGCYGSAFLIIANMTVSIISSLCFCPLYLFVVFAIGGVAGSLGGSSTFGSATMGIMASVSVLIGALIYGCSLMLSGATFSSMIYSIQPFLHEPLGFNRAVQRSIDLIIFRFTDNLLAFLSASLVFGALTITTTLTVGILLPLPLLIALGQDSTVVGVASGAAWMIGLTLALPPLPIWMALLYEQRMGTFEGGDLAHRIAAIG